MKCLKMTQSLMLFFVLRPSFFICAHSTVENMIQILPYAKFHLRKNTSLPKMFRASLHFKFNFFELQIMKT